MGAAQLFSPSTPIELGYLDALINRMTLSELGWKWQRCKHDSQRLELVSIRGHNLGCVWKSGNKWAGTSGNTYNTQKEAKAAEETLFKSMALSDLQAFEQYLNGFQVHAKAIFNLNGTLIEDDRCFEMQAFSYEILNLVLAEVLKERLEKYMQNEDDARRRATRDICANAVGGFNIGTVRVMFIEPAVRNSYRGGLRGVNARGMSVRISTLDNTGTTLSQHPAFPEALEVPIHRLTQAVLFNTLDSFIYDVMQRVRAAA